MNRRFCITIAAVGLLSAAAYAQQAPAPADKPFVEARGSVKPVPLPPGGPTPRMADGKPDFSGVWFPGPTGRANAWSVVPDQRVVEDPIPFQPWALEKYKAMSRTEVELYGNANVRCLPPGTPGMMTENPYAIRFLTKPGLFVHLIENNNRWRVVHTDGRPHKPKEEQEPLFNGDMVGKWEGDTLVIDTISVDERTWIRDGWFHSDELHVIERLPAALDELHRAPVHDRGSEGADEAVDVGVAQVFAVGPRRGPHRELLHQQRAGRAVPEAPREGKPGHRAERRGTARALIRPKQKRVSQAQE